MREITFRIARTGVVPAAGAPPPEYAPWAGASVRLARLEGDHAPGVVRPRDSVAARTDAAGEGRVALAPGRYRITLPSGESHERTLSAEGGALDLAAWLAGGVEPEEPEYETLLAHVDARIDAEVGPAVARADAATGRADTAATGAIAASGMATAAADAAELATAAATAAAQEARDAAAPLAAEREAAEAAMRGAEAAAAAAGARAGEAATDAEASAAAARESEAARDAAAGSAGAADAAAVGATAARDAAQTAATDAAQHAGSASAAREDADAAAGRAEAAEGAAAGHAAAAAGSASTAAGHAQDAADAVADLATTRDAAIAGVQSEGSAQVALVTGAGAGRLLPADAPEGSFAQRVGGVWVAVPHAVTARESAALHLRSILFWDDFASGAGALTGRIAPSGHQWSAGPQARVHADGYVHGGLNLADSWGRIDVGVVDVDISFWFRWIEGQGSSRTAICLHFVDMQNRILVGATRDDGTQWAVQEVMGGVTTTLASFALPLPMVTGAWYQMRARKVGARVVVYDPISGGVLGSAAVSSAAQSALGAIVSHGYNFRGPTPRTDCMIRHCTRETP